MIFVTTGMDPHGFERLVRKMDEIAGRTDEEVIMQVGKAKYTPKHAKSFDFTDEEEMKALIRKARVVVTHGGAGTILSLLREGVPAVVVPRLKRYGEHIDDHQSHLARELAKAGKVTAVFDIEDLREALARVDRHPPKLAGDRRLINALRGYVSRFARDAPTGPKGKSRYSQG